MHSLPQSPASGLGQPADFALRPLLSFLRRPVFASAPPGRLGTQEWLGWMSLLIVVSLFGAGFDKVLVLVLHLPVPGRGAWEEFIGRPSWPAAAVLLASPALEELGFRAFLSIAPKFVFTGLALFSAYIYLFIHNGIVGITPPISPARVFTAYLHALWVVLAAGAISLLLYRYARDAVLALFRRRARWVFWVSCIVFGAGHHLLYSNGLVWWAFLLVMPQFLAGVLLAYLRASFGLRWSVASHYALDMLALLPSWLYFSGSLSGLRLGALLTLAAALLAGVLYGLVIVRRVAQLRW